MSRFRQVAVAPAFWAIVTAIVIAVSAVLIVYASYYQYAASATPHITLCTVPPTGNPPRC